MTESSKPPGDKSSDPFSPVGFWEQNACWVNLFGAYDYLSAGYYASQDMERSGFPIFPTCKDILDSLIVPIFLEKAAVHGLKTPEYYITNAYFDPPVLVDTINPFMSRQSVVVKAGHQERIAKSLTRNFKYSICCQELPQNFQIGHIRVVLGWSQQSKYLALAEQIWDVFRMPLAKVRVITQANGKILLSGIKPLPYAQLTMKELAYINQRIVWRK